MMEINVAKVLQQKAPRLYRWVPAPLIAYLRRVVHQDQLNAYLSKHANLPPMEFITAMLGEMKISYRAVGIEKLDPNGRYVFASNHPFGGLDGLMLAQEVAGHCGEVKLVVNDILMNLEPLESIFIPVNKHGRQSAHNLELINSAFQSNAPIVTFPAGLCSRRVRGEVTDLPWKSNFVKKAIEYQRDIVPVFFSGELSNFFYRLSSVRSAFGLPNIEMLYLVDEMFKQGGQTFEIIVGKPIPWQQLADGQSVKAWCEQVRKNAYSLRKPEVASATPK